MRRLLMIIALTSLLSVQGLAGEIPTGGAPVPPPPAGIAQTPSETSPGEIPCDLAEQISEAGLSGLLAVLGLVV